MPLLGGLAAPAELLRIEQILPGGMPNGRVPVAGLGRPDTGAAVTL